MTNLQKKILNSKWKITLMNGKSTGIDIVTIIHSDDDDAWRNNTHFYLSALLLFCF